MAEDDKKKKGSIIYGPNQKSQATQEPIFGELGKTGTTIQAGQIISDEYVGDLKTRKAIDIYDKMRRGDGVVKSTLMACTLPIRSADWYVEPASNSDQDKEIASFVSDNLFSIMTITFDDFLRQALLMLDFGFIVFEKVFQEHIWRGKRMIAWRKFGPRLPKTLWLWETQDKKDGITQLLTTGEMISIPMDKLLVFTNQKEGENWEGISALRSAYRSWYFKEMIEKINAIGFSRQGLGLPYGELPKNFTEQQEASMQEVLQNMRASETGFLMYPEGWKIGFMDMKANTVKDPNETIRRLNREIFIGVLAQFLDLGSGQGGSYALSAEQSSTFHNSLEAIAKQVASVINRYAVKQLVDLNYDGVEKYPSLEFTKIGKVDLKDITDAVEKLTSNPSGGRPVIQPTEKDEDYMREVLGLPERQKEAIATPPAKEKPTDQKIDETSQITTSEFKAFRKLTFAEQKVKFSEINNKMNVFEERIQRDLRITLKRIGNDLLDQMSDLLDKNSGVERTNAQKRLSINYKGTYQEKIFYIMTEAFSYGKQGAAFEMKKPQPPTNKDTKDLLIQRSHALTDIMAGDILKVAKNALLNGLQKQMSEKEKFSLLDKIAKSAVLKEVVAALDDKAQDIWSVLPSAIVGGAINQGRLFTFDTYHDDIHALQRSEILDDYTCNYCLSVDSKVFAVDDSFTKNDLFHFHCRGIWVEILKDEMELPNITGISDTLRNKFTGLAGGLNLKKPIITPGSPADEFLSEGDIP
jgi:hypothetical protein